jgi:hypothetical protein
MGTCWDGSKLLQVGKFVDAAVEKAKGFAHFGLPYLGWIGHF